ncbi:MAG: MarC family protein [Acidimicrobiia bacterium]|jgi:multiple antibiotic resistance protein|nr:MAG: MarC family protein [Acidimicrobiia bacterium]
MDTTFAISAFVTLFVIIDPIGLAPLFIALTHGDDAARRRSIALRAASTGFGILLLFGLVGEALLEAIGISVAAFRIAGGLLLFATAFEMLFEIRTKRRQGQAEERPDPSIFPLATPLLAGPGSITSVILLTGTDGLNTGEVAGVFGIMALIVGLVLVSFLSATTIERVMTKTGIQVFTRVLGMLLAALSVQFVIDGVRAAFLS